MDMAVEHVQFWPTRWSTEGGVFQKNTNELSGMGLGLAAYTRFCEPTMFANTVIYCVRCFAAKGKTSASVWLINHSDKTQEVNVAIKDIDIAADNKLWRLESQSASPIVADTQLREDVSVKMIQSNGGSKFTVRTTPFSATIVRFGP